MCACRVCRIRSRTNPSLSLKDRKTFIKQVVRQRAQFASEHFEYLQSLKRVSVALQDYIKVYEHGEVQTDMQMDAFSVWPATSEIIWKKDGVGTMLTIVSNVCKEPEKGTGNERHLFSCKGSFVSAEETNDLSGNRRLDFYSMERLGIEGHLTGVSTKYIPTHRRQFLESLNYDYFWNIFTHLKTYGHPPKATLDEMHNYDAIEEELCHPQVTDESCKQTHSLEETMMDGSNSMEKHEVAAHAKEICYQKEELSIEGSELQGQCLQISLIRNSMEQEIAHTREFFEEIPEFSAYFGRRRYASITDIIDGIGSEFTEICNSAEEVSAMFKATGPQSMSSSELIGSGTMNPLALLRSSSSRSSSSTFLLALYGSRNENDESSSDLQQELYGISRSHQSTLQRLYIWERKLYEEVKFEEHLRIEYEKKWRQLKNHDVKGDEPSVIMKTEKAIQGLNTQITMLIRSIDAISKRINTLRDEELHPQLMEMIRRLSLMWRSIAHHHGNQKLLLSEARRILAASPGLLSAPPPPILARPASNLECEIRGWQSHLESWIAAQRSFVRAFTDWIHRCAPPGSETQSPSAPPPILDTCARWSRVMEEVGEKRAAEEMEALAAVVWRAAAGGGAAEEAEEGVGAVCKGLLGAVEALEVMAVGFAEGYDELLGVGAVDME